MVKYKHLTQEERFTIKEMLGKREPFSSIARELGRDRTTISKEVRNHITFKKTGGLGQAFNDCANRHNCGKAFCKRACPKCKHSKCNLCMTNCDHYEQEICEKLLKNPYVCNGCKIRHRCTLEKRIYSASYAQQEYMMTVREAHSGLCVSEEEALKLDELISPLILNGQSIHHICSTNRSEVMFSERTIYNYVDRGVFSARNIDLPRKVNFKPRKSAHDNVKIDRMCRIGRTFSDFKEYIKEHPDTAVVEMDSVIGSKGGSCLLTIHFTNSSFMLAFLRKRNTAASVVSVFDQFYDILEPETFQKLFPVILGDNGSEFSDPRSIEIDSDGVIRTKVFYCDPSSPYQKGAIENNHEFIRRVIPKGRTFDDLTQEKIDLMMDHINSYKRENLAWRSPYETFEFFYGRDVLDALGAHLVPAKDIILSPKLLK